MQVKKDDVQFIVLFYLVIPFETYRITTKRIIVLIVINQPINDSYGINFKRSLIDTLAVPAAVEAVAAPH